MCSVRLGEQRGSVRRPRVQSTGGCGSRDVDGDSELLLRSDATALVRMRHTHTHTHPPTPTHTHTSCETHTENLVIPFEFNVLT